ncbi:hypothetical protein C8T65DRAFT_826784 [Cerioporus squamosus]|nr:hypothetical protein C8T65DRAFT_826784 [Cerioporus squamosus]
MSLQSIQVYAKAEGVDAKDPIYPSNLSVALFELGDYSGSVEAGLRAWKRLKERSDEKSDLVARLSSRVAKALCYGTRAGTIGNDILAAHGDDIDSLRVASFNEVSGNTSALSQTWQEWDATKAESEACLKKRGACLNGLARLPLFFKPLDRTKEYYILGHDDLKDLTAGWGEQFPQPLDLSKFFVEEMHDIAFLYGGVGDARHVMASLCGLQKAYSVLPSQKKAAFRAHLTLLDIHEVTIARNLCIFLLIDELNRTNDTTERTEIKATLMLERLLREIPARFKAEEHVPPWMHVGPDTLIGVIDALDYWLSASAKKSTRVMLAGHGIPQRSRTPPPTFRPQAVDLQRSREENMAAEREEIKEHLLNMSHAQLIEAGYVSPTSSLAGARAELRKNMDEIVEALQETMNGDPLTFEVEWYREAKVFIPPEELRSPHPGFATAWKQVKDKGKIVQSTLRKVVTHIEAEWRPNITLFARYYDDPKCRYDEAKMRYPNLTRVNLFDNINDINTFNCRNQPEEDTDMEVDTLTFDVCSTFFEDVAAALKALENHILLEFRIGELCEELTIMRCGGDGMRPDEFPKKYMRMWLSNVPDYTHGSLNMMVYVVPNLQDNSQAAVVCNSLLNTSAWTDDEEFNHTYTLLTIQEVPRYLRCNIIDSRAVMDVLVLGSSLPFPRPLSDLATRDELTTWLTRLLFNTFIPGYLQPPPCNVRLPHNLVAFFGILVYLHRVGYPGHWLTDFFARVLSGRMVSDIPPFTDQYPIPVHERNDRVSTRTVRTDPWLVEFETIVATAYYAIPFPITSALPAVFSRDPGDIVLWEAPVEPSKTYSASRGFLNNPYEPRAQLLFYRSDKLTAAEVIRDMEGMEDIFEGEPEPAPGTFFILTAPEDVMYLEKLQFRLSRKRVERMRKEKWSVVAYRNDTGMQGTNPAPISSWIAKS